METQRQILSYFPLEIGLTWDIQGFSRWWRSRPDLDATVVMIDEVGNIKDAVYYNQTTSTQHVEPLLIQAIAKMAGPMGLMKWSPSILIKCIMLLNFW